MHHRKYGFTLAEVLIALALLGVVAMFTLPKVLNSFRAQSYNSGAKEVAGAISTAYQNYLNTNKGPDPNMTLGKLTPYLNYASQDKTIHLDDHPNGGANDINCADTAPAITCLRMPSGGTLFYYPNETFGGTTILNAVLFYYDPNSKQDGTGLDGPGATVTFLLYYNGELRDRNMAKTNTAIDVNPADTPFWNVPGGMMQPGTTYNPSWFKWN